ncbi:MAG: tetratricopeptide repeat protein, partial [Phyllobacterium sp.]|uniref:tetratricopeptide repeat protein n=1 Tax=Phyllobacterium sp. TaxID=1871046 RepID=UPI0030F3226C
QLHEGDFERSVVEAEAAAKLVPYDALSRANLAMYLANAGKTDQAIEWLKESIRRDASPMDWYFGNLAFAYYLADRPADTVALFQKMEQPWDVNLAAAYARLGKLDEAHASIAKLLKNKPGWTLKDEAVYPTTKQPQLVEPLLKPYLADLAQAGLPEK